MTRPVIPPVCAFAIRGIAQKKRKRQRDRDTEGRREREKGGRKKNLSLRPSASLSLRPSISPLCDLSLSLRWIISQTSQSVPPRARRASIRRGSSRLPPLFSASPARRRPRRPASAEDRSARHQA